MATVQDLIDLLQSLTAEEKSLPVGAYDRNYDFNPDLTIEITIPQDANASLDENDDYIPEPKVCFLSRKVKKDEGKGLMIRRIK